MIIKFNIVPIPIFSSKKNHNNKTIKLIRKAHVPTDKPRFKARPWCKTFQGDAPIVEIINNLHQNQILLNQSIIKIEF